MVSVGNESKPRQNLAESLPGGNQAICKGFDLEGSTWGGSSSKFTRRFLVVFTSLRAVCWRICSVPCLSAERVSLIRYISEAFVTYYGRYKLSITFAFILLTASRLLGSAYTQEKGLALARVAQWIECWPANPRVAGLIHRQGTCLGYGPGTQ